MQIRRLLLTGLIAVLAIAAVALPVEIVIRMPGQSFRGELPPLTAAQRAIAARLEKDVTVLAGEIGERHMFRYEALEEAARHIEQAFEDAGHRPVAQTFTARGRPVRNIEVIIEGSDPSAAIIVVGAHYDTVRGSPGANDNATGVAAVLELARMLKSRPIARSVHLVAFVNEEAPFSYSDAMGSLQYVRRLRERGQEVAAMLSLETMGYYTDLPGTQRYPFPVSFFYPDTGDFIGFVGNVASRSLVRRVVTTFRRHARFPSEGIAAPEGLRGVSWSDHWAFWRQGVPAVMVTDTALYRYPQYHTADDLPGIVDNARLAPVVEGLAHVVEDLAANGE